MRLRRRNQSFDTEWFPTRGDSTFQDVKDPGAVLKPLHAAEIGSGGKIEITGTFGVFFPGKLVAYFYSPKGLQHWPNNLCLADEL